MSGLSESQPEFITYITGIVRIRSIGIVINGIVHLTMADRWASFQSYHYEKKDQIVIGTIFIFLSNIPEHTNSSHFFL